MRTLRKFVKYFFETLYWTWQRVRRGKLSNTHYEFYYTTHFGLDRTFYDGKRVLDIGCGPRGSLEWADMTRERIGLDPLVPAYRRLGIDRHAMSYAAAPSEKIPFEDGHFDVVCSVNSLDHVGDLDETIAEIIRVLAAGGTFLLVVDVHAKPTLCEPVTFSWDIVDRFKPAFEVLECRHYEKKYGMLGMNLRESPPFDHDDPRERHGILSVRFRKCGASDDGHSDRDADLSGRMGSD